MLKIILIALLPFLVFSGSNNTLPELNLNGPEDNTGTLEKMIVASAEVSMDLDLGRLDRKVSGTKGTREIRFDAEPDSFFTIIVFNNELRSPLPSSMKILPQDPAAIPAKRMKLSAEGLAIEYLPIGGPYEMAVRDAKTGFTYFNIEGHVFDYDANHRSLKIGDGRLLVSNEFAARLGRMSAAGSVVGEISITATMRPIEITRIVDGEVESAEMPALNSPLDGTVPGPDVIVGNLTGLAQFGSSSGTQVGLAIGTDSCNAGTVNLNWFALPNNDHPVIPQNLYRMSGGTANNERFEQIGQSNVKHAFTALTQNLCGFGCNGIGGSRLGSGCSDPYSASLNSGPNLGSRAWINPFTGAYPRGDSATPPNNHSGHAHAGPTHRILTEINDLVPSMNPGATYYAEAQYVTPHEYTHCVANPTQCNMYNNVSYRRYNVTNSGSPFSFSAADPTVRIQRAVAAWPGAEHVEFKPDPGIDGVGEIAYKVTNPSPGVWHYEYAIFNETLDRAIQSFSIPLGGGATLSNIGFHAPPQHPGSAADGTFASAGFSSAPWAQSQTATAMTWSSETITQNPNANAIRWGTMYNFRFDSNRPPVITNATLGFLKTGAPITVAVQGPSAPAPVVVKSRADFDGDGKTDLSVFRPSDGNWYLSRSTDGFGVINFGLADDIPVPGDYDGDGKADAAIFRASPDAGVADYYILNSNGFTVSAVDWGTTGDIPISGDYNGDGKSDLAVWRPSTGVWYILNSVSGTVTVEPFGLTGDIPLAMDNDGDGRTNLAVFRPSNNTWYIARPTGTPATNFDSVPFGLSADMPVPADYDNDNKDDIAMFRPSSGDWYIIKSSNGTVLISHFGASGDVPVPGDYDGDGADDVAIFRGGTWYVNRSTAGVLIQGFGLGSDIAIPKKYIP